VQGTKGSLLGDDHRLDQYAGLWVVLNKQGIVVGKARTYDDAEAVAGCHEDSTIWWVSPHWPYVMIPRWPVVPLKRLTDSHSLWLVGGAVRDLLVHCRPHDWDFACRREGLALARLVADVLGGSYYPLDPQRSTGRVVVHDPDIGTLVTIDIAELRGVDIESDLQKRDFTVNAMALTLDGELIDPLHGYEDLRQRCLRMTHPSAFIEDPVRIVRLARLASALDYTVDEATYRKARDGAPLVQDVAPERVRDELLRALPPEFAASSLEHLLGIDVLRYVLPEVTEAAKLAATAEVLQTLGDLVSFMDSDSQRAVAALDCSRLSPYRDCVREDLMTLVSGGVRRRDLLSWGGLFALAAERETTKRHLVRRRLHALRFSKRAHLYVETVAVEAPKLAAALTSSGGIEPDRREIYRFFRRAGDAGVGSIILALALTPAMGHANGLTEAVCRRTDAYLDAVCCARDQIVEPRPLLSGRDLMAMGIREGPAMGRILAMLRESQAAGEVTTREEAQQAIQRWLVDLALDSARSSPQVKPTDRKLR